MLITTWIIHAFVLVSTLISSTFGFLDFYIDPHEVYQLLGLQTPIYYVKNGTIDDYTLSFEMFVKPQICDLNFTWRNLVAAKMPYSINLLIDNIHILGTTHMNISREGLVPTEEQVFSIGLPCAGKENAEAKVAININITVIDYPRISDNQRIFLSIRRNRICEEGLAHTFSNEAFKVTSSSRRQPSLHSLTLALCFLLFAVFLFAVIIYICTCLCQ